MLTILNNLESLRQGRCQRRAVLLTITRTDGVVFRFTDHNATLTVDGDAYEPVGSFVATSEDRATGLRERTIETYGAITSDKITEADLLAGKYEGAQLERRLVDWMYPWAGSFQRQVWWVDTLTFNAETWHASLKGWLGQMQRAVGDTVQRVCPHVLGDGDCTKSLTAFTTSGCSPSLVVAGVRRYFYDSSFNATAEHYYRFGKMTFTSGANAGTSIEIKDNILEGGVMRFDLQLEMPYEFEVTDVFTVVAGCDGRASTCKDTFNNLINFGGYPFVPGNDKMINPVRT